MFSFLKKVIIADTGLSKISSKEIFCANPLRALKRHLAVFLFSEFRRPNLSLHQILNSKSGDASAYQRRWNWNTQHQKYTRFPPQFDNNIAHRGRIFNEFCAFMPFIEKPTEGQSSAGLATRNNWPLPPSLSEKAPYMEKLYMSRSAG